MSRVLLFLCIATPAAAALPPVPSYAVFGHWLVACDNTRHCQARGFGEASRLDLRLERDAGPVDGIVTLAADAAIDPDAIRIDGTAPDAGTWHLAEAGIVLRDPGAVRAFVTRMRNAQKLTVGDDDVPLDGMTAALLRIDAVQGRPGTPGALIAPTGPAAPPPAPDTPPRPVWHSSAAPAPPPSIIAATRRAAAATLRREACNKHGDEEAFALDTKHTLVLLPCSMAAYQGSTLAYIVPAAGPPIRFSAPLPTFNEPLDSLTDPSFDPATGTLYTAAKGRGLADCGFAAQWVWSGGAFRLAEFSYQTPCGGAAPGDWPILWRTR